MTYANVEDRRAYAKAHYEKNKDRYNPARKQAAADARFEAAITQIAEKKKEAARIAKAEAAKARSLAKHADPASKVPATFEGQMAIILREHFAKELPRRKPRQKNGLGLPLLSWMLGAGDAVQSKIIAVQTGQARYPYTTLGASGEVLVERIAQRYQLTPIQTSCLTSYVGNRYRGHIDCGHFQHQIGIIGQECFYSGSARLTLDACQSVLEKACKKIGCLPHKLPLRAILDERITTIFLLIQLNSFLQFKRRQN